MAENYVVAVLGGGSFGTVIANIIAVNGSRVRLWLRNSELADSINQQRQNLEYLPGYQLDDKLIATTALAEAVEAVDIPVERNFERAKFPQRVERAGKHRLNFCMVVVGVCRRDKRCQRQIVTVDCGASLRVADLTNDTGLNTTRRIE